VLYSSIASSISVGFGRKTGSWREFKAWFGKREIKWLDFNFYVFAKIVSSQPFTDGSHQVACVNAFVYVYALYLVKSVLVAGV
jgi:hypothetical protein